jgi:FixJ family two-component response regulator
MPNKNQIIIVDDDPDCSGCRRLLRQYGFGHATFDSIRCFRTGPILRAAFCIVLDINPNDDSGIELRRQLSKRGVSLPVIFSRADSDHAARRCIGCAAYLPEPGAVLMVNSKGVDALA